MNKVLSQITDDGSGEKSNKVTLSTKAMDIIDAFTADLFERITGEAIKLLRLNMPKKKTVNLQDVKTAVKLVLPGELGRHACAQGQGAVDRFQATDLKRMRKQAGNAGAGAPPKVAMEDMDDEDDDAMDEENINAYAQQADAMGMQQGMEGYDMSAYAGYDMSAMGYDANAAAMYDPNALYAGYGQADMQVDQQYQQYGQG